MVRLDERYKILLAVVLGIVMFSLELLFSVFSIITFNLAGFVLVLFLTGIPAGNFKNALISATLTLLLMIPVGIVLFPFTGLTTPNNDIVSWTITVMLMLICRPIGNVDSENNAGLLCLTLILLPVIIIFFPMYLSFGIVMACVGGLLGKSLWARIEVEPTEVESTKESNNQE